jgi:hypothetical protein
MMVATKPVDFRKGAVDTLNSAMGACGLESGDAASAAIRLGDDDWHNPDPHAHD